MYCVQEMLSIRTVIEKTSKKILESEVAVSVVYFVERDHWAPGSSQIMRCRCGAHEDKLILEPGWRVIDVVDVVNKKEEFVHNFVLKGKNIEFWKCVVDVVDGMMFAIESDFEKQKCRIIVQTFKLSYRDVRKVNKRESKIKEKYLKWKFWRIEL